MNTNETYERTMWDMTKAKEDPERCIRQVTDDSGYRFVQCSRKRGHGPDKLFCKQHAKVVSK